MTTAQLNRIETAFEAIKDTSGVFVDPNGDSYTVTLDESDGALSVEMVNLAYGLRWNVGLSLREV